MAFNSFIQCLMYCANTRLLTDSPILKVLILKLFINTSVGFKEGLIFKTEIIHKFIKDVG